MSPRAWSVSRHQLSVFLTIELAVMALAAAALAARYTLWILLVSVFFAVLLAATVLRAMRRASLFDRGRLTSGVVTQFITTSRGAAEVVYRFTTEAGGEHVGQQPLSRSALRALTVGQTVAVAYDPADPRRCVADPAVPSPT